MRKFKNLTALTLAFTLSLSLCSCGKIWDKDKKNSNNETSIESSVDGSDVTTSAAANINVESNAYAITDGLDSDEAKAEQKKFDDWCLEEFKETVNSDSLSLNYSIANPEAYGITPVVATFGDADISLEAEEKAKEEAEKTLNELEAFNYDLLTPTQKYDYDVYHGKIELAIESADFHYFTEPFAYTSGYQSNLPIEMAEYNFYDRQDVDDYIALLNQVPQLFNAALDFEKDKANYGMFMSDTCANEVIRQCNEFIANPEENLLIVTFDSHIAELDGLTDEEIEAYRQANHDAVMNSVIPAYKNVIKVMSSLRGKGKNDGGLANFENGKEYYRHALKSYTGSDKTPEEVISILDEKLQEAYNDTISLYINYPDTMNAVLNQNEFAPYETFTDYVDVVNRLHKASEGRFPTMPEVEFTTQDVHKSLEEITSPAFYMTPALDAYTKNSIYINKSSVDNDSLWDTLAHEGVPGHMFQFTYYLSTNPSPLRTALNFNGYQEGWATYAENLSYDLYDKFEYDGLPEILRLDKEFSLYLMARIEIGVNYEGWSLAETTEFLGKYGLSDEEAVKGTYDYVVEEPVNYQMYILGYIEFTDLRELAEAQLGDKFNEAEYHKVLLDAGPSQFYNLRKLVDNYIVENK